MRRAIVAGGVAVVGVALIAVTFTQNLFRVGTDFEELITDFRPILEEENVAAYQRAVAGYGAVAEEFDSGLAPWAAGNLGITPDQFGAYMVREYPAVAAGMDALPGVTEEIGGLVDLLDEQRANFASADAIPTENSVAQFVPWGLLVVGVLAVVLAAAAWFWRFRPPSAAAFALGILILVGSFLFGLPGKAGDADDLNAALKPVYTEQTIAGAQAALSAVGSMGAEMESVMLPELAERIGYTPEQFDAAVAESFPAIAGALGSMEENLADFGSLGETFAANLENYETLRPVSFSPIIWLLVFGGLVMAVLGAVGALGGDDEAPIVP